MTKRKAQNSILFLTTLSVYLGLVLVGGSPSVLAQAALTQKLEIAHEFDLEDDLDNKPDGDRVAAEYAEVCEELARLAAEFSETIPTGLEAGKYSFDYSDLRHGRSFPSVAQMSRDRFHESVLNSSNGFTFRIEFDSASALSSDSPTAFYAEYLAGRADLDSVQGQNINSATIGSAEGRIIVVTNLPRASIDDAFPKSN